jgi:hypothetical protein
MYPLKTNCKLHTMQHYILLQQASVSSEGGILLVGNPGAPRIKENKQATCKIIAPTIIKNNGFVSLIKK